MKNIKMQVNNENNTIHTKFKLNRSIVASSRSAALAARNMRDLKKIHHKLRFLCCGKLHTKFQLNRSILESLRYEALAAQDALDLKIYIKK